VHWAVTKAPRQPTAADEARALAGLKTIFAKVERKLDEKGVTQAEWDAAVDEAVEHVRSQRSECESS
jgi:hypothetical protein